MAVFVHNTETLKAIENQLKELAGEIARIRNEMPKSGIAEIRVDNEKDRAKGIQQVSDWIVEADVALNTAKIRTQANRKAGVK